jgi:hypothetical protein
MKGGALSAALLLAAAAAWLALPPSPSLPPPPPVLAAPVAAHGAASVPGAMPRQAAGPGWFGELTAAPLAASDSMADARLHGDPRTPPLLRAAAAPAGPNAAQLADPHAYRAYQAGQDARVMAAFADAVQSEVPRLQADVERARASGIPAERIARVEAKIRRLQQLRRDIADPGSAPRD